LKVFFIMHRLSGIPKVRASACKLKIGVGSYDLEVLISVKDAGFLTDRRDRDEAIGVSPPEGVPSIPTSAEDGCGLFDVMQAVQRKEREAQETLPQGTPIASAAAQ
jgi:hypothetical protein